MPAGGSIVAKGQDRETFAEFYRHAAERQTLFFVADNRMKLVRRYTAATGPITYIGGAALAREIATLKEAVGDPSQCFLTSTAPSSLEPYRGNEYYKTPEEFVWALAEALRVEYEAIVNAGFLLQIDDAWTAALWDRIGVGMGLDAFKARCFVRVEALNHALRNVPEDRVRYHFCWGSWHGPHAFDLPMADLVDVMLAVKASFYSFEAANVRHEHEYHVLGARDAPAGQGDPAGRRHALHRSHRASRAGLGTHPALRAPRRPRPCDREHRLRLRRPHSSADCLGQAAVAEPGRGPRQSSADRSSAEPPLGELLAVIPSA